MIALIFSDRCTECDRCVDICPTNVFDARPGQTPVIARQQDCETCFMCELYCKADAIYVEPEIDRVVPVDAQQVRDAGLLGQFRRDSGWDEWSADPQYSNQHWRMDEVFALARSMPRPVVEESKP